VQYYKVFITFYGFPCTNTKLNVSISNNISSDKNTVTDGAATTATSTISKVSVYNL